ncbi:hypothetical protein BDR05DRAFT_953134 [Suillus weaverae]|nr:hypothetical protein BDR05DRAFT_953134 [Suillus weaverae]
MVGLTRNVPNKPATVPFRPPGAIKPRSAVGTKWKPEATPVMSGAKRVRPAGEGKGDRAVPATFLDPFEPPRAFEPEMSVAESEALTRQIQQQQQYRTEEQAEDENEEGLDDNPDGYIDPVLRTEGHQPAFNKQHSPTPVEDEEYSSFPPSSPLAAPRHITKAHAPVPLNPVPGWTGLRAVSSRPSPVTPLLESRESSVTPASSMFKPRPIGRRLALQAPTPRSGQTSAGSFQLGAPTTLPLCSPGYSTRTETSQRPGASSAALLDKLVHIDTLVSNLCMKIEQLELVQGTLMQELVAMLDDLRGSNVAVPTTKSVDKATKAVRDNIFNIRNKCCCSRQFWMEFSGSWSNNAEWCNDMIHYVREKACKVYPQLHAGCLAQKMDTDIVRQLREVFESTKEVVKKGAKGAHN